MKIKVVILIGLSVAAVFLASPKVFADCNTDFPYGFFSTCGPDEHGGAQIGGDGVPNNGDILTGTSLTVRAGFFQDGPPRRDGGANASNNGSLPGTMAFVTIDGSTPYLTPMDASAAGVITGISNGGSEDRCPNTLGFYPYVTYGYRDLAGDGSDASPIGYNPSNGKGRINCKDSGRMVYWDNPSSGNEYSFRLNTPPGRTGEICMRLWVAVRFTGDSSRFPAGMTAGDPDNPPYPGDQRVIASHLAKSSGSYCVNVVNSPPTGTWTKPACTTSSSSVANFGYTVSMSDPNHGAGEAFNYRFKFGTNATPTLWAPYSPFATSRNFTVGQAYTLQLKDPDIPDGLPGAWVDKTTWTPKKCPGDQPPAMNASAGCEYANVQVGDPNSSGSMHVFGAVYKRDPGSGSRGGLAGSFAADIDTDDSGNGGMSIPWLAWSGAVPDHNSGWIIDIGVHNENADESQGAFIVMHSIWIDGPCYQTDCSVDVVENVPGSPANGIQAGQPFNVNANISAYPGSVMSYTFAQPSNVQVFSYAAPSVQSLPSSMGGHSLGLARSGGSAADVNGYSIYNGGPGAFTFTVPAADVPNSIGTYSFSFWSSYIYKLATEVGANCDMSVDVYRHYRLTPRATLEDFNDEDPTSIQYRTWITADENITNPPDPVSGVPAQTSRRLYKEGSPTNIDGVHSDTSRFNSKDYGSSRHVNPYPIVGGDRYCAEIYIDKYTGWLGPGDKVSDNVPNTATTCDTVTNKPYWKVYGTGVSAGGNFTSPYTGGGTIGGWNNSTGVATYPNFGASTELHGLALQEIVGFATSRNAPDDGDPISHLAFANNDLPANPFSPNAPVNDNYSPFAGGYFQDNSAGSARKLPVTEPKTGVTRAASRTIAAQTLNTGQNVEEFVEGDVHITGNVTYNTAGWAQNPDGTTNIPSFKVVTNGNIYISPNVTRLDGYYEAKGQIYTCANSAGNGPVSKNSTYTECRNQLTVHGSFVAKKVNLMRTFGSLRNEKPNITASTTQTTTTGQSVNLYRFGCTQSRHYYSTSASGGPAGCNPEGSLGGILPGPTNGSVPIYMWTDFGPSVFVGYGFAPGSQPAGTKPVYVVHNTDSNTYLYTLSASAESFGYPTSVAFYIYNNPGMGGVTTTRVIPSTTNPPTLPLRCSNSPTGEGGGTGIRSSTRETCAAEVFDFSPEFYLSKSPNVEPPEGGLQYDSFTSLPPVL